VVRSWQASRDGAHEELREHAHRLRPDQVVLSLTSTAARTWELGMRLAAEGVWGSRSLIQASMAIAGDVAGAWRSDVSGCRRCAKARCRYVIPVSCVIWGNSAASAARAWAICWPSHVGRYASATHDEVEHAGVGEPRGRDTTGVTSGIAEDSAKHRDDDRRCDAVPQCLGAARVLARGRPKVLVVEN
jgi:hypothetical protein